MGIKQWSYSIPLYCILLLHCSVSKWLTLPDGHCIFVCYLCTGAYLLCFMCENTDITWLYVLPVDCHIVVSICCTCLVIKSQGMQQLMYNCAMRNALIQAALDVQSLALWQIENLWLTVARQERHFITTRSLTVACISAEATTSSQTWWSQQNMSVVPVICENHQFQNLQGDGQRP